MQENRQNFQPNSDNAVINKRQQEQLLKLATKNFYNELIKFGLDKSDIVTASLHLLDHFMEKDKNVDKRNTYYNQELNINKIKNDWTNHKLLQFEDVSISTVNSKLISKIASWLANPAIKYSFVSMFPEDEQNLYNYLQQPHRSYFIIYFKNEAVGLIGADNIDTVSSKLEMRKFIGNIDLQGKGLGKRATFLFLYYVFMILKFNKVYIYSGDTNIANINLNAKFGFELEGIFFEDAYIGKERHDIVRMGLLRSRWLQIFYDRK